jgi:hypothetical protein
MGPRETGMATNGAKRQDTERRAALLLQKSLASGLPECSVKIGENLIYKIEVDPSGKVSHGQDDIPKRGQYAFQTDVLISKKDVPLVVIELKAPSFSSHDVVLYSAKAAKHKSIYPYIRFGFVVFGSEALGRRFLIHNEAFDFALAVPDAEAIKSDLHPLLRRQIRSAEKLVKLMAGGKIQLHRYEENVDIDNA